MQPEPEDEDEDEELIGFAGECKMKVNCVPQLKANMVAVAGALAYRVIDRNFDKITIHGLGFFLWEEGSYVLQAEIGLQKSIVKI